MAEKQSKWRIFTAGIIREAGFLRLVLGCCSALAVTTTVSGALGMGLAMTFVLVCSNIVISALRKVIPAKVHLPCYIVIIATFVTIVQMVLQTYVPALYKSLGVFLALIVVNCIILGRAEDVCLQEQRCGFCTGWPGHGLRLHPDHAAHVLCA